MKFWWSTYFVYLLFLVIETFEDFMIIFSIYTHTRLILCSLISLNYLSCF
nr:MAG TPA: hypothetical protein [Caudoviricetes sp.]